MESIPLQRKRQEDLEFKAAWALVQKERKSVELSGLSILFHWSTFYFYASVFLIITW
jgi:hypothetical protein